MKRTQAILLIVLSAVLCSLSSSLQARTDEIDNPDRLQFLNEATGASDPGDRSSTFENRLEALFSTETSQERSYVAAEDAQIRQEAVLNQQKELLKDPFKTLNPERYDPKKNKDSTKVEDSSAAQDSKTDGSERNYEKARAEIQKEFDERIKKKAETPKAASVLDTPESTLPLSLANNPFYKGTHTDGADTFESRKTVIMNRLIERGISKEAAAASLKKSVSEEDLILALMKEQDISYGDANEMVS